MKRSFAAPPPRSERANVLLLTLAFAGWFGLCYGGAAALAEYIPWRVSVQLPLDARMPFLPAASALYLTIGPMLLLAPFVLRDLASLVPLFLALMLESTIAFVFFVLMPIDDAPVSCHADTWGCVVFRLADTLNLHHNNLPSLHVAFAWTLVLAFATHANRAGLALLYAWAIAVSLSTGFTHQHFAADVVAGLLLALLCWRAAGAWGRKPLVAGALDAELLALRNIARMARRHRRYLFIGLALYSSSLPSWRRHRLTRVGFAFLQTLDDILDGDRASEREPLEVADEMAAALRTGEFADHDLARLGASFRAELLARGGAGALDDALALIRAMRNDRRRVLDGQVCTREELREIHRATFTHSVNLMLRAADSPVRAADLPELIDALGLCSTVRDLREDLEHGLINLPADVIEAARKELPQASLPDLAQTSPVRGWLRTEKARLATLLDHADDAIARLGNQRGVRVLVMFARSMRRFTR